MTQIRTKDKLFLALVLPTALLAAYVYLWRLDVTARIASLNERRATLVAEDAFAATFARAQDEQKAAEEELAAERAIPPPVTRVKARADESLASREKAVLDLFRAANVTIAKGESVADAPEGAILKATGTRPEPQLRAYVVSGAYPDVVKALTLLDKAEMAVVPEAIEMRTAGHDRWTITLWL